MSKFPEGLKATDAGLIPRSLLVKKDKENEEIEELMEMGLQETDEFKQGILCFNGFLLL